MAKQRNRIELLPLFFLLAISCGIPFVVYMHLVDYPAVIRNIYAQPNNMDFFTYNRVVWLYILTGSALFWFLINEKSKSCWYHRPLVAYSFFVVVSTIFSEFPQLAFFGDPAHHEGMLAHLCYMCIVFLFINLVKGKRELKIIVVGVLVSSALLAVIGIFQFFGYDYFYSDFPAKYLVPDSFKKLAPNFSMDVFKPRFVEIISTFGNGNCVGSYMTMLFSLSFVMLLGNFGRWRFCLIPLNLFLFFNLMACGSRAGMLGALVACVSAGIFSRHRLRSKALAMGLLSVSFVIVLLLMTNYTVSSGHSRLLASYLLKGSTYSKRYTGQFKSLELRGNEATVLFDDLPLRVRVRGKKAEFFDQDNTKAPFRLIPIPSAGANGLVGTGSCAAKSASSTSRMVKNAEGAQRRDSKSGKAPGAGIHGKRSSDAGPCYQVEFFRGKFPGYKILVWPQSDVIQIGRGKVDFQLKLAASGFMFINQYGRVSAIKEVESFGFKGWEHFANRRGYVWSRSIPLLKKTLLIGFGPDNFVVKFPNHDYLGKLRFLPQGIKLLFDKPHNLYLQIALNTGVLSLLAVLILVGVYLYDSAILYRQHPPYGFAPTAGLGIAMAVVAYMVAGIFNDSMVGVAPVFWSLLGLGIAANRINSSSIDGAAISGISHSMPGIIKPRRKQPLSSKKSLFQRRRGAQRC